MRTAFLWRLIALLALIDSGAAVAVDGKWVGRGQALVEFPACHQLWVCVSSAVSAADAAKLAKGMPKGTWGTCENNLQGPQAGCGKCLVSPPDEVCKP